MVNFPLFVFRCPLIILNIGLPTWLVYFSYKSSQHKVTDDSDQQGSGYGDDSETHFAAFN